MILLGLAALLVGGIGVANGVEAWLAARATRASDTALSGASAQLMSAVLGFELALLGLPGILLGLVVGGRRRCGSAAVAEPAAGAGKSRTSTIAFGSCGGVRAAKVALVFAMPPLGARRRSGAALFRAAVLPQRLP